jgi:DNA-directed RNA polymerase subunit RPC12/RpoP
MSKNNEDKQYFSILQWLTEKGLLSEKGEPFDFRDRPWLIDILCDWNPQIVLTACAQVGKSVTFSVKALFAIKHLHFNIIYTMSSDSDVNEFVSSKFNKIVQSNIHEFEGMATDNVERKEFNDRFIFFKGTNSKTAAISTTADLLIHDEISRSDQLAIETYKSRTKASQYKGRWMFSNPGTERDELDLQWNKSDQKEWVITCPHCQSEHFLVWPDSIDLINKCYICKDCKKPISDEVRRKGKWVAQNPGSKISGYHISHLMCCWISAEEVISDSEGDPAYFNNFVLGKSYSPGDLSVSKTTILDLWTPKELDTGERFLGVDVGNLKHYVIRSPKGIIKLGRFTKWSDLDDLIRLYKPTSGVIDAMPDNTAAKYYVDTYPWMQMSFFMENTNNPQTIVWWGENDKKGVVYSHRDRILDKMLTDMIEAKWLIGVPTDDVFRLFIKHFETLRREKVVNNKGIERYVWGSTTGEDHFVFACLYSYLAMLGSGSGVFFGDIPEKVHVIDADNNYDVSRMFKDNNPDVANY